VLAGGSLKIFREMVPGFIAANKKGAPSGAPFVHTAVINLTG